MRAGHPVERLKCIQNDETHIISWIHTYPIGNTLSNFETQHRKHGYWKEDTVVPKGSSVRGYYFGCQRLFGMLDYHPSVNDAVVPIGMESEIKEEGERVEAELDNGMI